MILTADEQNALGMNGVYTHVQRGGYGFSRNYPCRILHLTPKGRRCIEVLNTDRTWRRVYVDNANVTPKES